MEITKVIKKGKPLLVRRIMVGDLEKSKCSAKFLAHKLPEYAVVNVKCTEDGEFELRGKREEYRIIVEDPKYISIDLETNCDPSYRISKEIDKMKNDILEAIGVKYSSYKF